MKRLVFLGNVIQKGTNKRYSVYLNNQNLDIYMEDRESKEIFKANKTQDRIFSTKYQKQCDKYLNKKINRMILKVGASAIIIALAIKVNNRFGKVIFDVPRIVKEYSIEDQKTTENILNDIKRFLTKNENLSRDEKLYIYHNLEIFITNHGEKFTTRQLINAYNQLANCEIEFKNGPINTTEDNSILGEYKQKNDKIIIYYDRPSVALHEILHCIFDHDNEWGISLEEGYVSALVTEDYQSALYFYNTQNEHLNILSEIVGQENIVECLNSEDCKKLCKIISAETGADYNDVVRLIYLMDRYSLYEKLGQPDPEELVYINKKLYELAEMKFGKKISSEFMYQNLLTQEYTLISSFLSEEKTYTKGPKLDRDEESKNPIWLYVNEQTNHDTLEQISFATARYLILEDCTRYYETIQKEGIQLHTNWAYPELELLINLCTSETKAKICPSNAADIIMEELQKYMPKEDVPVFITNVYFDFQSSNYLSYMMEKYRQNGLTYEDIADIKSTFDALKEIRMYNLDGFDTQVERLKFIGKAYLYSFTEEDIEKLEESNLRWSGRNLLSYGDSKITDYNEILFEERVEPCHYEDHGINYIYYPVEEYSLNSFRYIIYVPLLDTITQDVIFEDKEPTVLNINGVDTLVQIVSESTENKIDSYGEAIIQQSYSKYMQNYVPILTKNKD